MNMIYFHRRSMYARIGFLLPALLFFAFSQARENIGKPPENGTPRKSDLMKQGAGCAAATSRVEMNINNVRTLILNGGDMWWNLTGNARYEIPKVSSGQVAKHSLFAGALWIGGLTQGNLRIAAQTYRQSGNDYYPGPLQLNGANITAARCTEFDKIYKINFSEIETFQKNPSTWGTHTDDVIGTWPAKGGAGEATFLAPFYDANNDNEYNPIDGDHPTFDQNNVKNIPDQMLYMIYNDKGNIHSETEGLPIGLEIHLTAFGYATNDEVNNMTFYRYVIHNRGNETLDSCIFGKWVDADLGNYADDFVECDVTRNLGICYNGDDNDEGILGYGLNPPCVAVNFFEGPKREDQTQIGMTKFVYYNNDFSVKGNPFRPEHFWNFLNGRWHDGQRITYGGDGRNGSDTASYMFPGTTDPAGRPEWTEKTSGNSPADRRFLQCAGSFTLLPGAVNRVVVGVVWARATSGGARGSFNLLKEGSDKAYALYKDNFDLIDGPDAPTIVATALDKEIVLTLTDTKASEDYVDTATGLCSNLRITTIDKYSPAAFTKTRNLITNPYAANERFKFYHDTTFTFDTTYTVRDTTRTEYEINDEKSLYPTLRDTFTTVPVARKVTRVYVIKSSILTIFSDSFSVQKLVVTEATPFRSRFKFQGYQIYQIKRTTFQGDVRDPNQAKLVAQCDIKDGTGTLVNVVGDAEVGSVKQVMVNGEDNGIRHTFRFTQDQFAVDNQNFVNFKTYYYTVRAYASNINCVDDDLQYLAGRNNVEIYDVTPRNPLPRAQGTQINSFYGDGPEIRRVEGIGNGGTFLRLSRESIAEALVPPYYSSKPLYEKGFGPVKVRVIDPFKIPMADFELRMLDTSKNGLKADTLRAHTTFWMLKNLSTGEVDTSERTLSTPNEQVFLKYGLSVVIAQTIRPGDATSVKDNSNGYVGAEMIFSDPSFEWLTGVPDIDGTSPFNWIRSGTVGKSGSSPYTDYHQHDFAINNAELDPYQSYEKILDATWSPYALAARAMAVTAPPAKTSTYGPAWVGSSPPGAPSVDNPLSDLMSVDVVITPDKTKWSRSLVLELGENPATNIGSVEKMYPRASKSLDINGNQESDAGFSWFPGYAINVETGERLNIMFGEDSSLPGESGTDMVWNPTRNYSDPKTGVPLFGGKHNIYVVGKKRFRAGATVYNGSNYDGCKSLDSLFDEVRANNNKVINLRAIFSQVMWVNMPILDPLGWLLPMKDGLVPGEVTIRLRVQRPYANFANANPADRANDSMPLYTFNTSNIAALVGDKTAGNKALDMVNISPNPYYAYAGYEDPGNQLDTRVKIINLPRECRVSIYTQSGFLVKRIVKNDDVQTWVDWDLKNDANVPISSGIYIIHIDAPGLGERVIKWFGVMRPADFDTF